MSQLDDADDSGHPHSTGGAESPNVAYEKLLRDILDLTADSIVRFDSDMRYDYVNDQTVELTGRSYGDWIGRTQVELGYPAEVAAEREGCIRDVFATGQPATYLDEIANFDVARWYESRLFPQLGADGLVAHVVIVARDITDRKLADEELVRAATQDTLTGLANRASLINEIQQTIDAARLSGELTAVLLVDLDHFKVVNDSLGHAVGDQVLQRVAERLSGHVHAGDLLARHGGDEFVILMRNLQHADEAVLLATQIVTAFRDPLANGGMILSATTSIGVTFTTAAAPEVDAIDLLREADTAMFVAKESGRDGISVFDEHHHVAANEKLRIAGELRGALERGELAMWYQPEVDIHDGTLHAVEALLRWHHPTGETYTAARFIDVATETGLIVDIGNWALEEICTQAARWDSHGLTVRFNLAPRQLADPHLLANVDHAIEKADIDPARLCMEITEAAFLQDTAVVFDNLDGLSNRGIAVAIDDFGTGYASLTYLRRYHIDVIKIDRSFVTHIATNDRDRNLTGGIVALAHHLGMTVTVEGIEHPDQATILRELGCTTAQGFLYSAAIPPEEIDAMLVRTSAAETKQ